MLSQPLPYSHRHVLGTRLSADLEGRRPDFLSQFHHFGFERYGEAKVGLTERKIGNQRADDILAGDDNQLEAERFADRVCPLLRDGVGDTAGVANIN